MPGEIYKSYMRTQINEISCYLGDYENCIFKKYVDHGLVFIYSA